MKYSMSSLATILLILITVTTSNDLSAATISVEIQGIEKDEGDLLVAMMDRKNFEKYGKDATVYKTLRAQPTKGSVTVTFDDVAIGEYAINVLHDEDENQKMTNNLIGLPKEQWGVSNNARARFGPPKWEESKIVISADTQVLKLEIRLR